MRCVATQLSIVDGFAAFSTITLSIAIIASGYRHTNRLNENAHHMQPMCLGVGFH